MAHSGKTMTFATDLVPQEDNIYNLGYSNQRWKIYGDLQPLSTKTYNAPLYNSSSGANYYQTFATVTPVDYNALWIAHYRITITANGHSDYTQICDVSISGRANTYYSYKIYNSIVNYSIYQHMLLNSNSATVPHELGYRMQGSYGADSVAKVVKIELLEQINCTITLLDDLKLYTSATPSGYIWRSFNATYNGLQEVGDANDTGIYIYSNGFKGKAGSNKVYRYCLFARTGDGTYESFVMQDNTRATTKTANPHGFVPDGKIYWNSGNSTYSAGNLNISAYEQYHVIDYLYSFNFNNTFLPDYCETYVVYTYNEDDGLLYLDTTQWLAAALPTSADGKIYQRIGSKYYTGTSNYYQGSLLLDNPYYEYRDGKIRSWSATHLSSITGADDLKAIEAISSTSGLLKKTAANTWTLDTKSYVTSSGVTKVSTGAGLTGGDITTTGTVKANLTNETKLTNAAADGIETSGRVYPVRLDKNGKLAVNVPWTNVNSSYLPLAGGIMTGNIRRYYSAASTEPMITMLSNNQDIILWEAGHGTAAATTTTSNHYKLLYRGTGQDGDNSNQLQLIAHKTDDVVAIQIDEIGKITLPQMATGGAKTPIYINSNGVITAGNALKNLAYKDSLVASDIPDISGTYATNTKVNGLLAAANAMTFKGVINATNALPNSHNAGDTYRVGTAGTYPIVDSNGRYCEVGTLIICITDGTAASPAHWTAVETNEDGAVIGPSSSTANQIAKFSSGTGRVITNSGVTIDDNNNLTIPSNFNIKRIEFNMGTSPIEAGWRRICKVTALSRYQQWFLSIGGIFASASPTGALIGVSSLNQTINPILLSCTIGSHLKKIRFVCTSGNVYWLDIYCNEFANGDNGAVRTWGNITLSFWGNVEVSEVQTSREINTSTGGVEVALRTLIDEPTFTLQDNDGTNSTTSIFTHQNQTLKLPATIKASLTGNATNVTGTVAVDHGGTNATTAAGARANLGTWALVSDSYNTLMPADGTTNGWVKIGKSNSSYGLLPSAAGAAGSGHNYIGTSTWYWKYAYIDEIHGNLLGNATSAGKLTYRPKINTLEELDAFHEASTFKVATLAYIEGHSGTLAKNDGIIISVPWSASYGHQFYIDDNSYQLHHRFLRPVTVNDVSTPTWADWVQIIDSSNYTSYTVKKDGTGATGSWGISISGKAATAGTADKISNLVTTDQASSTATWRRVWISYNDNVNGRPAYTDNLVYQTSTNTLKTPHLLIEHVSGGQAEMHITYSTTIDYWWGVGTANENHGLYDNKAAKWILSAGAANTWTFVGNVTGNVSGSAGSVAWTNVSSRPTKISLTGAVTGSVSLGAGELSLATTVNHTHSYAGSSSAGGAATNATTTANTTDSIYPVGVKSGATTTLLHDTSITMKGGAVSATTYTVNSHVTLQYNTTDSSLEFVFA